MICGTCLQKLSESDDKESIWGFNPYVYHSFYSMRVNFHHFYTEKYNKNNNFFTKHNEDGYTYAQWYIYILSSNQFKYKKLHLQTVWFFEILSTYPFFKEFIRLGSRDMPKYNTLHHYLKYMNNMGGLQKRILSLLLSNGLFLEDTDNEGISGYDYLHQKTLSDEDKKVCSELTRNYKMLESQFDVFILTNFGNKINKCEKCNEWIEKYEDLKNITEIKENSDMKELVKEIITYRQECIDVYKKYENCNESIERHQYVVDSFKSLL